VYKDRAMWDDSDHGGRPFLHHAWLFSLFLAGVVVLFGWTRPAPFALALALGLTAIRFAYAWRDFRRRESQ